MIGNRLRNSACVLVALLLATFASTQPAASAPGLGDHGAHTPCQDPEALPNLACARAPTPSFDAEGRLWLVWYQRGHLYVQSSTDQGHRFTAPVAVNRVPERVDDQGEDRPQIKVGPQGDVYVLWTQKLDQPYTGHIRFSRSIDGGQSFSDPLTLNDDGAAIAHRFPVFEVDTQGHLHVAWIDKRDLEKAKADGRDYAGAALYYAVSRDRGQRFPNQHLVDQSCECCRLAMALDQAQRPVILYRHIFPGSVRDHALLRIDPVRGAGPSQRISDDHWVIEGCPHQGPALAVSGAQLHLAWFTAGERRQGLFYAHVDGQHISAPQAIGQAGAERVAVAAQGERVVLAWKAFVNDQTQVFVQQSNDGGSQWQLMAALAVTQGASDHPLLVQQGAHLYLSWQTAEEGYRLIPISQEGL
jgi:hypothetical protein